ncbi:hypothetical protein IV102_25640 [bacterium]|nr:hypothetical protein [bacterium]
MNLPIGPIFLLLWLSISVAAAPPPEPTKKFVSKVVLLVVTDGAKEAADLAAGLRRIGLDSQLAQEQMPIVRFSSADAKVTDYMVRLGFDNAARPLIAVVEWSDESDLAGPKKIVGGSVFREIKPGDEFTLKRAVDHWKFRTGRLSELPESKEKAQIAITSLEAEPALAGKASLRLRLQNEGKLTIQGPISITVSARSGGGWTPVQTLEVDKILAGNVVTRELLVPAGGFADFKAEVGLAGQTWQREVHLDAGPAIPMVASAPVSRSASPTPPVIPGGTDFMSSGRSKYSAGNYAGAILDFTQQIQKDANNNPAFLYRGLSRFQTLDYRGAVADFSEAIRLDPSTGSTYNIRAVAHTQLNDLNSALADYNKLLELDPGNARGYRDRGWLRKRMGDGSGADQDLAKAKSLDSSLKIDQ